jgi:hypothetical protein
MLVAFMNLSDFRQKTLLLRERLSLQKTIAKPAV